MEHPKGEADGRLQFLGAKPFGFDLDAATPRTRAWLAGIEAEAHALLDHDADSRRALEMAESACARPDAERAARPRATFFDAARLAGEHGICLGRLGHAGEAQAVLRTAIAELDPGQEKSRPRLIAALGVTHARQGDVEEACRLGRVALEGAVGMAVQPNVQDVVNLRGLLEQWRDVQAVRDLDELLTAARGVA